jgi:hypothetical protein
VLALPDDLVDGGKGDSRFQGKAQRDGIAVVNMLGDGVDERPALVRQR